MPRPAASFRPTLSRTYALRRWGARPEEVLLPYIGNVSRLPVGHYALLGNRHMHMMFVADATLPRGIDPGESESKEERNASPLTHILAI